MGANNHVSEVMGLQAFCKMFVTMKKAGVLGAQIASETTEEKESKDVQREFERKVEKKREKEDV